METFEVECLQCGLTRVLGCRHGRLLDSEECPRCHYLGWAPSSELTERERHELRERTPQERRVPVAA